MPLVARAAIPGYGKSNIIVTRHQTVVQARQATSANNVSGLCKGQILAKRLHCVDDEMYVWVSTSVKDYFLLQIQADSHAACVALQRCQSQ